MKDIDTKSLLLGIVIAIASIAILVTVDSNKEKKPLGELENVSDLVGQANKVELGQSLLVDRMKGRYQLQNFTAQGSQVLILDTINGDLFTFTPAEIPKDATRPFPWSKAVAFK